MNTRERLKNYGRLVAEKKALEIQLKEIEGTELKAVNYDCIGTSYGTSNTTQNLALRKNELKEKHSKIITEKALEIAKIENSLTVLNEKERELIKYKYIENSSWEYVAYKIDRTTRTCKNLDREAIKKIESILNYNIYIA